MLKRQNKRHSILSFTDALVLATEFISMNTRPYKNTRLNYAKRRVFIIKIRTK